MIDVVYRLGEQDGDVLVEQFVDRETALAHAPHEAEMAEQPQLMRDEGLLEADCRCQRSDRARPVAESRQKANAAWSRKGAHRLGHCLGGRRIDIGERHPPCAAVAHEASDRCKCMNICSSVAAMKAVAPPHNE